MDDEARLRAYREAAAAMRRGDFRFEFPPGGGDPLDRLGRELQELAHGLERRFAEFQALNRMNQELNSGLLLEEVLERVYSSFRRVIPYDRIGFALLEDEGRTLRAHWAKMEYSYPVLVKGFSAPMAGSSLASILETGRPRIINDLEAHLKARPGSTSTRLMLQEGVRSSLTCPLKVRGKAVGFLFFSSRFAKTYEDAHVDVFLQVADTVSAVVEKSRLYGELLESNRVKNAFLGMAAHDLRGPLGNILIYADLLGTGVIEGEVARRDAISNVGRIAESTLKLVESLLDVTAIEAGTLRVVPRHVELRPFLGRVRDLAALSARRKSIDVCLVASPSLPETFALDADRIEQALGNLLGNAVKFSPAGARVLLMARPAPDGGLELGVHDEGPGLSESSRRTLFKDFSPGKTKATGGEKCTGLGLAIVRRIAEAHGGKVRVVSAPGAGSIFILTLPAGGGAP